MMSFSLQPSTLLRSVGNKLKNIKGESIGKIVEIIEDSKGQDIQYLVLQSSIFFGIRKRFFAIPASSLLLKVNEVGNIILRIDKDDLLFAKGTYERNFPKPNLEIGQPIFEIFKYESNSA